MTRFRVTAVPAVDKGFRLVNEYYDDRKDADECFRQLCGEGSALIGCGYAAVVVAIDESKNDGWDNLVTKLVTGLGE